MATAPKLDERNVTNAVNRRVTNETESDSCGRYNNSEGFPLQSSSDIVPPQVMARNSTIPQVPPPVPPNLSQVPLHLSQVPPPIPPRLPATASSLHNRIGYGYNGYLPYGRLSATTYPTYSGYGGIGGRYSGPQTPWDMGNAESALIRLAEESSRPAFQSIESIVNAVGSISMMLESTYHAVYSSYRAVLGVVEQFSRLRNHLADVLSTLTLLRTLQWLCLKILYLIGIRKTNPSSEVAWSIAENVTTGSSGEMDPSQSSWPIFMFLGLVFGAPWLIFRLFSKLAAKKNLESNSWTGKNEQTYAAIALYDFQGAGPGELCVRAGQQITLAPKSLQPKVKGWLLAETGGKTGLVPSSYIRLLVVRKTKTPAAATTVEKKEQPPVVGDQLN